MPIDNSSIPTSTPSLGFVLLVNMIVRRYLKCGEIGLSGIRISNLIKFQKKKILLVKFINQVNIDIVDLIREVVQYSLLE